MGVDFDLSRRSKPFAKDLQMQLAGTRHHHFAGLRITRQLQHRIFFGQLMHCGRSLFSSPRLLGRDRQSDHRFGNSIGGSSCSPSDEPTCRSSILAMAMISPAEAESIASVCSPWTAEQRVQLDLFADAADMNSIGPWPAFRRRIRR